MSYSEKLKDPRWQRKRLEVLERDGWECQVCNDKESTLHVHHRTYEFGKDPWDYPSANLVVLCEECHSYEEGFKDGVKIKIKRLYELGISAFHLWNALHDFEKSFKNFESKEHPKETVKEKKKKTKKERKQIVYPFISDAFMEAWALWKEYKKIEHKFIYKSEISEQGALMKLNEISKENEVTAIKIIHQSISNGWSGIFELKQLTSHGTKQKPDYDQLKRNALERMETIASNINKSRNT